MLITNSHSHYINYIASGTFTYGLVFPSSACSIHAILGHYERRYSAESVGKVEYCDTFENYP